MRVSGGKKLEIDPTFIITFTLYKYTVGTHVAHISRKYVTPHTHTHTHIVTVFKKNTKCAVKIKAYFDILKHNNNISHCYIIDIDCSVIDIIM